jgi:hypothetical protein
MAASAKSSHLLQAAGHWRGRRTTQINMQLGESNELCHVLIRVVGWELDVNAQ